MPPKFLFTREKMVETALNLVRKNGAGGLTARALAAELGCSVKPIFGIFQNMEEVKSAVLEEAGRLYRTRLNEEIAASREPPYKAAGLAYIRYADEEKELFKLLFMRDRTGESNIGDETEETRMLLKLIQKTTGFGEEAAYRFHLETWIYVHGIATMIATGYLCWDAAFISEALSDCYWGLKQRLGEGKTEHGGHTNGKADQTVSGCDGG